MSEPQDPENGRVIEVPDEPHEAPAKSGERSLLVPLVVVPALIVMVFVLVWTFFSSITGREATPEENVERLLHGGKNERTQAAFNLVRQALEDWETDAAGGEGPWVFDQALIEKVHAAWEDTQDMQGPDDVPIPLALAILLAQLGDEGGVERLAEMTRLSAGLDPDGEYRSYAGFSLGALGERLDEADRAVARQALLDLVASEDQGLRMVGAIALQTIPGPETIAALRALLVESSLELRGNAALSLARLGDDAGRGVLLEMLQEESYRTERERKSDKWARGRLVSESRRKALLALAELGALPERTELERLAEQDPDPEVRELARRLVVGKGNGE